MLPLALLALSIACADACVTPVLPCSLCCAALLSLLLLSSLPCARCVFSLHGNWHSLNPISSTLALVAHGTLNALCSCYSTLALAAATARSFLFVPVCFSRINNSSAYKIIYTPVESRQQTTKCGKVCKEKKEKRTKAICAFINCVKKFRKTR